MGRKPGECGTFGDQCVSQESGCDPQSQRLQAVGQYKDRGVTVGSSIRGATVDLGKVFAEAEDYPHR